MARNKLYAHIVMDRSGSMGAIRQKAISAVNEYIQGLANDPTLSARVSVTFFHQSYGPAIGVFEGGLHPRRSNEMVISHPVWNAKARDVRPLTTADYVPDGGTPLLDAIGLGQYDDLRTHAAQE